jgi:hypothetical protein
MTGEIRILFEFGMFAAASLVSCKLQRQAEITGWSAHYWLKFISLFRTDSAR